MNLSNLFTSQLLAQFGNNGFTPPLGNFTSDANTNQGAVDQISNVISTLLTLSVTIAGLLLLANLIIASIEWIGAGGDSDKIDKAKARITQSVIGIVIFASAIAIFKLIENILGINLITFMP
jgi:type IV secretion system pilin